MYPPLQEYVTFLTKKAMTHDTIVRETLCCYPFQCTIHGVLCVIYYIEMTI
jgi:hypothetical protein